MVIQSYHVFVTWCQRCHLNVNYSHMFSMFMTASHYKYLFCSYRNSSTNYSILRYIFWNNYKQENLWIKIVIAQFNTIKQWKLLLQTIDPKMARWGRFKGKVLQNFIQKIFVPTLFWCKQFLTIAIHKPRLPQNIKILGI